MPLRSLLAIQLTVVLSIFASACSKTNEPEPSSQTLVAQQSIGSCVIEQERDELVTRFSKTPAWNPSLNAQYVMRERDLGDGTTEGSFDTIVSIDGRQILQYSTAVYQDGSLYLYMNYESPFSGVRHAQLTSADRSTGVMIVDGRETHPFPLYEATTATFVDGGPTPELSVPDDVRAALERLMQETESEASGCLQHTENALAAAEPRKAPSDLTVDRGHRSYTYLNVPCVLCNAGCSKSWGLCLAGLVAASAACGPFAFLCGAGAVALCSAELALCVHACRTGDVCCPVDCKSTLFMEACCADGESCLNSNSGLCCSPGKYACNGSSCCDSSETCCGSSCCGAGETCFDPSRSQCCGNDRVCGSACCADSSICVNAQTSTCCSPTLGETACGNDCCSPSETCVGWGSCCPREQACGDTCCPEGEICDPTNRSCRPRLCPPNQLECGTSCCPPFTGCDPNTNTCCPADEIFCPRFNQCVLPSQCIQ